MSIVYGVDFHPQFQSGIKIGRVSDEGFDFAIGKCSQGTWQKLPEVRPYIQSGLDAGMMSGGYHMLDSDNVNKQLENYLSILGDPKGKIVSVDFEDPRDYGTHMRGAPSITDLYNFVYALREEVPWKQKIWLYSAGWFFDLIGNPDISALVRDKNCLIWPSRYILDTGYASQIYQNVPASFWTANGGGFGGQKADVLQFTDRASIAGFKMDANAFRGTYKELKELAFGGEGDKPIEPARPKIRPYAKIWTKTPEKAESIARNHRKHGREAEVGEEELKEEMSKVDKGLAKALEFRGIKYGYWTWQRNFVLWADAIPTIERAREIGGVCSSVPNVYRLINGMSAPAPAGKLKGGTGAWFAAHAHHRLRNINQIYEAGTLFMSDYRGEAVDKQGHVAVAGETGVNPWLCQSDTGLGWNDQRRLRDTQEWAKFTHFARPGEWLG